jgi:plasmid stability protein
MPSVTIRNVPSEVHRELAVRAAREGKSLDRYLRERLVEFVAVPTKHEVLERIKEQKRRFDTPLTAEEIVDAVPADRR